VKTRRRVFVSAAAACLLLGLVIVAGASSSARMQADPPPWAHSNDDPAENVDHDVSAPLRDLAVAPAPSPDDKKDKEPKHGAPFPDQSSVADPVVQSSVGSAAAPALGAGFEGVGQGFTGPSGTFVVTSAPPDPNGAVGPNHFVEIVNQSFAIFDKSGTPVYGPVPTNTLWSGFGGGCQTNDDGDATVEYDKAANRWIISQFSVSTRPYLQCVAVSTSGDPTGSYARYSFQYGSFPDYPKLGVWPDAYYTTFNMFGRTGNRFTGPEVCAYDRSKMLAGQAATQQCFLLSTVYGSLLPSDLDGATPPPAGSPNYLLSFATNSLQLWKFHVDWANTANTTLSGPTTIPVAAFSPACGGGTCIPQAGTSQTVDSLADRLMYRLAYRNFGDHESLVVDHSVVAGSSVGVRWYELRSPGGTPTVYQQGTYAPDSSYRWMGSVAMDQNGDIALGYSVSSSSLNPGIRYTARLAGDPLGQMTQGEGTIVNGTGSQTGGLSRWGDYTSMSVDPSDDCTFWYTNQYLASSGAFNWHTRIGSFKLNGCGGPPAPSDFSISANPSSLSVAQGSSGTSTISTAVTSGSAQSVSLSATAGVPPGTSVSFNPNPVTAGGSSTMTVNVGAGTATGNYTLTITGTGSSATHATTVALTVTTPPPSDFSISANPSSLSVAQGSSGTSTISTAVTSGSAQSVSLSASGVPAGSSVSFNPNPVTAGGSSTMTVNVGAGTATGNYTLTITGAGSSAAHATTVALTVTTPASNDFSISANPSSLSVAQGSSGASTISTAVTSGSAESVSLGAGGVPAGSSVSFNPNPITAGGSSTMTVNVGAATATGNYTLTITGASASAAHATTVALTVTAPTAGNVVNGDFETGNLSGWTPSGAFTPVISTTPHAGSYAARLGSTSAVNGNSTLTQAVAIPSGSSRLTFWYQPHCTDTITYDQIQAQIRNASGATLATVLNVCSNSGAWTQVSYDTSAFAGQTVTLWFNDHDDGYPTDPTYFLLDDVAVGNFTPPPPPPTVVQNGGFESGNLSSWTASGAFTPVISTAPHTGSYAARLGSTGPVNGDSTLTQSVALPAGTTTLTFWYQPHCTDTITYDQIQAQIRNTSGVTLATVLNVCSNSGAWTQVTYNVSAYVGQTIVLWFNDHDDGYLTDPTYFLLDDVAIG
jgi:hypothetical protein